ncbi:MAG: hypothetical protein EOO43_21535, partial [Flavobacterium sp.]
MRIIALTGCAASLPSLKYLYSKKFLTAMICPEHIVGSDTIAVENWALFNEIPCWQVPAIQVEKELNELIAEIKPDLIIVYGFPQSINNSWLRNVKYGGWNIHFSLHQNNEASITIHQLAEGEAYGNIINQFRLALLS